MTADDELRRRLELVFRPLNNVAASRAFPAPGTLSQNLSGLIPRDDGARTYVDSRTASQFSTAAVDMWLRGVHSFLISASLTTASPIWASVSGYYASHYAVRAVAHVLGYFQLFKRKRVVELSLEGTRFFCTFRSKNAGDAEHKLYWKLVKSNAAFRADNFFTENDPSSDFSDARHRNHANYSDHLSKYPVFRPLSEQELKDRIDYISKIVFDTPPLPRFDKFPDLEYVQLIAYHRIIRFRRLLDEAFGTTNRFWRVHRNPRFASDYMDFQLSDGNAMASVSEATS